MTNLLLALCLSLPLLGGEATSEPMGPFLPRIKAAEKVTQAPYWVSGGMKSVLRDIPGAVVAVDEEALPLLSKLPSTAQFLGGTLRIALKKPVTDPLSVETPDWNNPLIIRQNGNVVHRSYEMLALRF